MHSLINGPFFTTYFGTAQTKKIKYCSIHLCTLPDAHSLHIFALVIKEVVIKALIIGHIIII